MYQVELLRIRVDKKRMEANILNMTVHISKKLAITLALLYVRIVSKIF